MVERVIRFETELFHAKRLSSKILAATLIMSNQLIDKEQIKELWEEIKMLDVLDQTLTIQAPGNLLLTSSRYFSKVSA